MPLMVLNGVKMKNNMTHQPIHCAGAHPRPNRGPKRGMLPTKNFEHGFSLLEVLIALILFSLGILGVAALQANSLRLNYTAYEDTQATLLLGEMVDRLRANRTAALNGECNALTAAALSGGSLCALDVNDWRGKVADYLPEGTATIECDAAQSTCTVEMEWSQARHGDSTPRTQYMHVIL